MIAAVPCRLWALSFPTILSAPHPHHIWMAGLGLFACTGGSGAGVGGARQQLLLWVHEAAVRSDPPDPPDPPVAGAGAEPLRCLLPSHCSHSPSQALQGQQNGAQQVLMGFGAGVSNGGIWPRWAGGCCPCPRYTLGGLAGACGAMKSCWGKQSSWSLQYSSFWHFREGN